MTTTLRSVRHAACVVLVLGLVTSCSSETPADDADRLSQDGDSVTARSGVGPAIDAELVLKDLMLWMRDNHDLAPLLHPENSDWLERFAPRGPSGEQTVALSFALRSALSREMEKAALLREGFDASSPGKAGEARPEESSCVAEREHTAKEMEDLRRALSSARAEADERQRALEEELREKKKAHDEVRALYEAALLAARDAEERSAADPAEEVDADSEGETSPVAAVLEEEGDDEEPEPPVEEADDFEPEPTAETTDDEEPEPPVEEADDFEPEPPVEEADDFEPEPPVEETDDFEPEPSVEEEDGRSRRSKRRTTSRRSKRRTTKSRSRRLKRRTISSRSRRSKRRTTVSSRSRWPRRPTISTRTRRRTRRTPSNPMTRRLIFLRRTNRRPERTSEPTRARCDESSEASTPSRPRLSRRYTRCSNGWRVG